MDLASCRLVFDNLAKPVITVKIVEAREAMALASYYGGLAISQALVGYVHAISHNLGAKYGVPHGLGNAMVLPHVMELIQPQAQEKFADIARHCGMGSTGDSSATLAQTLVDRVWALNEEISIPGRPNAIQAGDIDALVQAAISEGGNYASPRFITEQECRNILVAISA